MVETTNPTEAATAPLSDVKQSFAWGQLFAGSVVGSLGVWKLAHKLTHTEPSEWFTGLSIAYEEVRNFVMTPFSWIELHLTASEQNALTVCLVVAAALLRAATRVPVIAPATIGVTLGMYLAQLSQQPTAFIVQYLGLRHWLGTLVLVLVANSLLIPATTLLLGMGLSNDHAANKHGSFLILLTIVFVTFWGIILLLLNWSTS